MLKHLRMARKTVKSRIQIGFAENEQYRCMVTRSPTGFIVDWQVAKSPVALPDHLQAVRSSLNFAIIHAIPHQFIWHKTFTLPLEYNTQRVLEYVHYVIEDSLPVTFKEIYYDYQVHSLPEQNIQEVTAFIIRKTYADKRNTPYRGVLDSELNCFWRSFQMLGKPLLHCEYRDEVYQVGDLIFQAKENIVVPITHVPEGEKCLDVATIEVDKQVLDKPLYFAALGATLWEE